MVGAAGSDQTAKVTTSKLTFNASTGSLNATDIVTSTIAPSFVIRKENTTGEGGQFQLQKSDTSTLSGDLVFDLLGNTLRIYESATPFKGVAVDIGTQGSQSALLTSSNYNSYPPTNLSTTNANWSTNGTVSTVVGQLGWKNYGNGHTIFDASANTSPAGTALQFGRENAEVAWTPSYPTLMGWNTANTFGVRVDSTRSLSGGPVTATTITASGDITAFSGSDKRLKTNIIKIENALDKVNKISGITYDWTEEALKSRKMEEEAFGRRREAGVIAQEIEEVLPEVVIDRDDGYKAVRYEKLVPLLIEAIKEMSTKIDILQNRIEELENEH